MYMYMYVTVPQVHAKKVELSSEVDLEIVARGTTGFSGEMGVVVCVCVCVCYPYSTFYEITHCIGFFLLNKYVAKNYHPSYIECAL